MSTENIVDSLFDNNLEKFRTDVRAALYAKAGDYMNSAKQEIASSLYNDNINEGYPYPEGEVEDSCFEKCHEQNVYGKGGSEYHDAFTDCVKRCKKKG